MPAISLQWNVSRRISCSLNFRLAGSPTVGILRSPTWTCLSPEYTTTLLFTRQSPKLPLQSTGLKTTYLCQLRNNYE